jgi:hypothetical protein
MIVTHHPPAPGGPALPAPSAARQSAAAVQGAGAVFAGPDGQLVRRLRQSAGVVCWEGCRLVVFARAGIPERHCGLITDEPPIKGEGGLLLAGGAAVRPQRAGRRAGAGAGLYLERVLRRCLAAVRFTGRIVAGRQGCPADPVLAAGGAG